VIAWVNDKLSSSPLDRAVEHFHGELGLALYTSSFVVFLYTLGGMVGRWAVVTE
jgi:hypothetical protein